MRELSTADRMHCADDPSVDAGVVARAMPVIDTVIRRRCRHWNIADDVREDLRSEAVVRLLRRLRDPESEPIGSLDEYVAGLTSRVIDDLVRTASPEWARLKHRVRYVLHRDDRFHVSTLTDGSIVCSLQRTASIGHRRIRTHAANVLAGALIDVLAPHDEEQSIDEVVSAVAGRMGVPRHPVCVSAERIAAAHTPSAQSVVESADYLRRLWSEIAALPRRQRLALLLNARDPAGDSVLRLLLAEGIATAGELAASLGIAEAELDDLWNGLPWIDTVIAERLQVTRQQVINLRKAARDRLARRMARPR